MGDQMEKNRLKEESRNIPWKKWGPYLSERQWGTVREDYSDLGDPWMYFPHDDARSRAYRWGEDGLGGISDDKQQLCFALALWNGKDPIIKERLFGLTNSEGNHGEDVKEYYYYLDSTPTHSYMKYLYKYPQNPYPYNDLVKTNAARTRLEPEYELIDTGVFNENKYFDVFMEYAKDTPEDILIKISVFNRGPEPAMLHLLPTLWFRNTWSWGTGENKPKLRQIEDRESLKVVGAIHETLGARYLYCDSAAEFLFTENETNTLRLFQKPLISPYVKDGVNDYFIHGNTQGINPQKEGTKVAAHYVLNIPPGQEVNVRLRLTNFPPNEINAAQAASGDYLHRSFDAIMDIRREEADEFFQSITPAKASEDGARVLRQSVAGLLWSKQFYYFDGDKWLEEHGVNPFHPKRPIYRNNDWYHMKNADIISMPDKWEYPWYASWDLAFHAIALSAADIKLAKQQLELMLHEFYLHPNGQIPAYEWNFSDVNPPVHAWASIFLYKTEIEMTGVSDIEFLKRMFGKLLLNFTWWINRKDRFGKNVFEGGFLGMDNIGVFDRSKTLPTGGYLEQADGTAWMVMFCHTMLQIATELAAHDPVYDDLAVKFTDHFLFIAASMNHTGKHDIGLWNEEDGFYYDLIRLPDGTAIPLKIRSVVGLLPLCAATMVEEYERHRMPHVVAHFQERIKQMPELLETIHPLQGGLGGHNGRKIMALLNEDKLRRILKRMLDENEFLSPYGIRSLSRQHLENPYIFEHQGETYKVSYLPAESDSGMFGGNSNWRGPVWFPINALILRGLLQFYSFYGDDFQVECPTGSGNMMNLYDISLEICKRLGNLFLQNEKGQRPCFGNESTFQNDPYWKDYLMFHEYFNGDTGAGLGATHQTGWTGLAGWIIQNAGRFSKEEFLEFGHDPFKKYAHIHSSQDT